MRFFTTHARPRAKELTNPPVVYSVKATASKDHRFYTWKRGSGGVLQLNEVTGTQNWHQRTCSDGGRRWTVASPHPKTCTWTHHKDHSLGVYKFCTWGNSSPCQQVVLVQIFIICLVSSPPFLFVCTLSDFWQHVISTGKSRTHLQLLTARNWTMVICSFGLPSVEMDWDWENVGLEKWKKKLLVVKCWPFTDWICFSLSRLITEICVAQKMTK